MPERTLKQRLLEDLEEVRTELLSEAGRLTPEELDWAPRPDMKTCKALLREIAEMEQECVTWLTDHEVLAPGKSVAWTGDTVTATLQDLASVRAGTLKYLEGVTAGDLDVLVELPAEWKWRPAIEPGELLRAVVRHEYYHLGQLITYRWILGDNPYKRQK